MKVRDLMTRHVVSVRTDDTLARLFDLMNEHDIRHVPVVDEDDTLLGLVTQRDLLRVVLAEAAKLPLDHQRAMLERFSVDTVFNEEVATVEPGQSLAEVGEMMLENKFGCVPVVDDDTLVGILTESDFVRHVVETTSVG